jgi:hypothetical protein
MPVTINPLCLLAETHDTECTSSRAEEYIRRNYIPSSSAYVCTATSKQLCTLRWNQLQHRRTINMHDYDYSGNRYETNH